SQPPPLESLVADSLSAAGGFAEYRIVGGAGLFGSCALSLLSGGPQNRRDFSAGGSKRCGFADVGSRDAGVSAAAAGDRRGPTRAGARPATAHGGTGHKGHRRCSG